MKHKRLIIVCTRDQGKRITPLVEQNRDAKLVITSLNVDACPELRNRNLAFKTSEDYGLSGNDITEEGINWFKSWSNAKIRDNKNIKELLVYEGISVWWLVNTWLFSSTFFYDSIASVLRHIAIIERILAVENPDMVCCFNDGELPYRVIRQVCQSKNIPVTVISKPPLSKRCLTNISMSLLIYGKWMRNILRKTCWQFLSLNYHRRKKSGGSKGKVLIFSGDNWTKVYNLTSGKSGIGDLYFNSVSEILTGKGYEVTQLSYPTLQFRLQISSLRTGKRQQNIDYKPFEHYLGLRIILRAMRGVKRLRKQMAFLNSKEFRDSLSFHDIPVYNLIKDKLSFAFSKFMTEMITAVEMSREMINKEKPGVIIEAGESPYDRALIATGRLSGIPVIGYQHGVMHPANMFYNNDTCDISPNSRVAAPYCPIASKSTVDGQYAKDILVERAKYVEQDVVVTGQPRYDILVRAEEVFDKDRIFQKFNLSHAKKLIVWTTNPHEGNQEEYEREAYSVYEALKRLGKEVQLITKLHPGELGAHLHYRVARLVGVEPIVTEYSIYKLLYACDLIITLASTTAIEAAILGKPIIVMNLSNESDYIPYVEEAIALGVYNRDDLVPAIKSILHDEEVQAKLEDARRRFVYKYAYLQDGQASQRFADLVLSTLSESRGKSESINS